MRVSSASDMLQDCKSNLFSAEYCIDLTRAKPESAMITFLLRLIKMITHLRIPDILSTAPQQVKIYDSALEMNVRKQSVAINNSNRFSIKVMESY